VSDYYGVDGEPITMEEWARRFEQLRHVGRHKLEFNGARLSVSTVWLGLDHRYGTGPPLIFETMVFTDADAPTDEICERYSTFEDAFDGHMAIVQQIVDAGGRVLADETTLRRPSRTRRLGPS
jgi:hypothetical protein